jgi:hypothetical protein
MIVIGILLGSAGLGLLGLLLSSLAVYALPFFAGVTASLLALDTGTGPIGAIVIGVLAAVGTLVVGQLVFASARSPLARAEVVHGLAALITRSEDWRQALAISGASIVGATAWARMTVFPPALPMPDAKPPTPAPRMAAATSDG